MGDEAPAGAAACAARRTRSRPWPALRARGREGGWGGGWGAPAAGDQGARTGRRGVCDPRPALPRPDPGEPPGPGGHALPDLRRTAGLLPPVGQPRRPHRAARLRRGHAVTRSALRPGVHRTATGRALAGRGRGPAAPAASTCPARTWTRFGVTEARPGRTVGGAAGPGADRVRGRRGPRALLDEGAPLVGTLRGAARAAVAGYVAGGRAALAAITAADYDVLRGDPPAARAAGSAAEMLRAYADRTVT